MTVAWLLPTITYYLAVAAFYVLYGLVRILGAGSGGRSSGDSVARGLLVAIAVIVVCAVVTLTVSAMFWAASVLFYREHFLVDDRIVAVTAEGMYGSEKRRADG